MDIENRAMWPRGRGLGKGWSGRLGLTDVSYYKVSHAASLPLYSLTLNAGAKFGFLVLILSSTHIFSTPTPEPGTLRKLEEGREDIVILSSLSNGERSHNSIVREGQPSDFFG